jgi:8-oxo-dGTP pyrophosphatase MutT (NUDIX family)/esterase/lipase
MTGDTAGPKRYRRNVGAVVFNARNQVWLGRRADGKGEQIWQFPQGGVDRDEGLLDAARRELFEETGIRSAEPIARAPGWITYDFPEGFSGAKAARGFAGQTQAWFAFRFHGEDSEIDLSAHHAPEFDAWRWADLHEAPDLVVAFKREAYRRVVDAFAPIAAGEAPSPPPRGELLMIHGVGCTGEALAPMAAEFRLRGWTVRAPTLKAALRTRSDPPAALKSTTLQDYVQEAQSWVRASLREKGELPVLLGHSMGGLIVQKLLEAGLGRAGVLVTPAPPAGAPVRPSPAPAFTFANILLSPRARERAHKVWRAGFNWGVLNAVPKSRRGALYDGAVYDSGRVFETLKAPAADPSRIAFVDETQIKVPLLVIGARKDRATPVAWAEAVAAKYPGSTFKVYPDHAHWIIDEPGSEDVVSDIDAWLEAALA